VEDLSFDVYLTYFWETVAIQLSQFNEFGDGNGIFLIGFESLKWLSLR